MSERDEVFDRMWQHCLSGIATSFALMHEREDAPELIAGFAIGKVEFLVSKDGIGIMTLERPGAADVSPN